MPPREPQKPRPQSDRTVGEIEKLFQRFIDSGGIGTYNKRYAERLLRIKIDGKPLHKWNAEFQEARSTHYGKHFLEALETAHMLVQMDMDRRGVNIERGDKPDIAVRFPRSSVIYVEQRRVQRPGMAFSKHREAANNALEDRAKTDPALDAFLRAGNLTVRISDPGPAHRLSPSILAAEVGALRPEIEQGVRLFHPDPKKYPALSRYATNVFYHLGQIATTMVFQLNGGWIDPTPPWVAVELNKALFEKKRAALGYDRKSRPLWLLLSLVYEELIPDMTPPLVRRAFGGVDITPFGGVVVRMSGMKPVVDT